MKTIYFIRHGQSASNVGRAYQGASDQLTDHGKEQAAYVAQRCKKLSAEALIASTMDRAQDTAAAISKATGLAVESSSEFVERLVPTAIIGRPNKDPEASAIHDEWTTAIFEEKTKRFEGAENFDDLKSRAKRALALLEERSEQNIIVVTHGFFLRLLMAHIAFGETLTGEEFKRIVPVWARP